jgi:XTP/dITP diphosphohydrolase
MTISAYPQIILASNNPGKIKEIEALLDDCLVIPQGNLSITEVEETGTTFIENAIIKARHAARYSKLPAIADDSGLVVDALDGAPGVISARYAGIGASDQDNINKLLQAMNGIPDEQRTGRFICVMAFMVHADDPCPVIAQGVWEGRILKHAVGANGFGYDPVFWVPGHQCSSAELPAAVKNALSHRGQALKQLTVLLKENASRQGG